MNKWIIFMFTSYEIIGWQTRQDESYQLLTLIYAKLWVFNEFSSINKYLDEINQ